MCIRDSLQLVLDLIPQGRAAKGLLDQGVEVLLALEAMALGCEHDVLVDGLVERVGLLEHHADRAPKLVEVLTARVDVAPIVDDLTLNTAAANFAVHEVQKIGRAHV